MKKTDFDICLSLSFLFGEQIQFPSSFIVCKNVVVIDVAVWYNIAIVGQAD